MEKRQTNTTRMSYDYVCAQNRTRNVSEMEIEVKFTPYTNSVSFVVYGNIFFPSLFCMFHAIIIYLWCAYDGGGRCRIHCVVCAYEFFFS